MAEQTEQVVSPSQMLRIREVMSDDEPGCTLPQTKDSSDVPFKLLVTLFANQTTQELKINMDGGEKFWQLKVKIAEATGLDKRYFRIFSSQDKMEKGKPLFDQVKVVPSRFSLLAVYDDTLRSSHKPFKRQVILFANQTTQELSIDTNEGEKFWDVKYKIAEATGLKKEYLWIYSNKEQMEAAKKPLSALKNVKRSTKPLFAVYDPDRILPDLFLSDEESSD